MQWTTMADVLRAVAAGVTAVIAALKFIYDIRQKQGQPSDALENDETLPLEEAGATTDEADSN